MSQQSRKELANKTKEPTPRPQAFVVTDPFLEFIASSPVAPFIPGQRALPESIDDAERDFGSDIYDKMEHDSIVGGTTEVLKMLVLEDGLSIEPRVCEPEDREPTPEEKKDAELATEIADFVRWSIERLASTDRDFTLTLYDMLGAISHGHRLAEINVEVLKSGAHSGRTVLRSVRTKPRSSYRFVTDEFNNLLGVIAVVPGVSPVLREGLAPNALAMPNAIAKTKLFILTMRARNGHPGGNSFYRACYDPWRQKQLVKPYEVKFMAQFAGGKQSLTLPEKAGAMEVVQSDGTKKKVSATDYFIEMLKNFSSGGAAVFPYGSTFTDHVPNAEGKAFEGFYDRKNREIVTALLGSARTLMETKRNSQADANTAENILDTVKGFLRFLLCDAVENQLFRLLVALNWGDDAAERLLPKAVMSRSSNPDFAANLAAINGGVTSGAITKAMLPTVLREKCGLQYIPDEDADGIDDEKDKDKKNAGTDDKDEA